MKSLIALLIILTSVIMFTIACNSAPEKNRLTKPVSESKVVAFPKHPGTLKKITMFDKTVEVVPIDEIPKISQFVYYDSKGSKSKKEKAVKAIPIVEIHMYSKANGKLVPVKKADYLWLEMYGPDGTLLKTHTMWRNEKNNISKTLSP